MGKVGAALGALADERRELREDVHCRARGTLSDGQALPDLLIVNLSPNGMMLRCEAALLIDQAIRVQLPVIGLVEAKVRWCLGGRIGAEFAQTLSPSEFSELLRRMR